MLDFIMPTRPNVPAIENRISPALSCERFKYPSCSSIEILELEITSPLLESRFSTFIKLTSPAPDLSSGVVPLVIKDEISRSLRCSQK